MHGYQTGCSWRSQGHNSEANIGCGIESWESQAAMMKVVAVKISTTKIAMA